MTTASAKSSLTILSLILTTVIAVAGWASYYFAQQEASGFKQQIKILSSKLKTQDDIQQDILPTKPPTRTQPSPKPSAVTPTTAQSEPSTVTPTTAQSGPSTATQTTAQSGPSTATQTTIQSNPSTETQATAQSGSTIKPTGTPRATPSEPPKKYNKLLMAERQKALKERDAAQARIGTILMQKESALKEGHQLKQQLVMSAENIKRLQQKIKEVSSDIQKVREQEANRFSKLRQQFEQELKKKQIIISELKNRKTVVNVTAEILFESGSATIKPKGRKVLGLIAETLNKHPDQMVSVEGHTDNIPISSGFQFPTNWELSTARAAAAARYLEDNAGVKADRMQVVGHGEHRPSTSNETVQGRAANRRIEIILLP